MFKSTLYASPIPLKHRQKRKKNRTVHTKIALVWNIFIIFFYSRQLWYFTWLWRLFTSQSWHKTFSVSREGLQLIFFFTLLSYSLTENSLLNVITILAIWRDEKKNEPIKNEHYIWICLDFFGGVIVIVVQFGKSYLRNMLTEIVLSQATRQSHFFSLFHSLSLSFLTYSWPKSGAKIAHKGYFRCSLALFPITKKKYATLSCWQNKKWKKKLYFFNSYIQCKSNCTCDKSYIITIRFIELFLYIFFRASTPFSISHAFSFFVPFVSRKCAKSIDALSFYYFLKSPKSFSSRIGSIPRS